MASSKLKRGEVDRWTGNGITHVTLTPENKKAAAEINAYFAKQKKGGGSKPKAPAKKK